MGRAISRQTAGVALGVLVVLVLLTAPWWAGAGNLHLVAEILCVFTMAQMWNFLAGYVGLVSLGHQAFIGIGAYALYVASNDFGISPFVGIPIAFVVCAVVAAATAPFLFRLRDAYFSIGIWVLAEILHIVAGQTSAVGGVSGMSLLAARNMDRYAFTNGSYWSSVILATAAVAVVYVLMRTRLGLGLLCIRDNERAAASCGVDVWRSRLIAFVISAAGCGAAGAAYYMASLHVDPDSAFDVNWVVIMLFVTILGGIGTIEGPVVGTLIYFGLREVFGETGNWYLIVMGAVAVVAMVFAPNGIWGSLSRKWGIDWLDLHRRPRAAARDS